jgi:hypothetical protein
MLRKVFCQILTKLSSLALLQIIGMNKCRINFYSVGINVRDFVHLCLDSAAIAVTHSLLDDQDFAGRRHRLNLDCDLFTLCFL